MIPRYDTKQHKWVFISRRRWLLYRLVRSNRYQTAAIGTQGIEFTGVNKIVTHEYKEDYK